MPQLESQRRSWFYAFSRGLLHFFFKLGWRLKIEGQNHVPQDKAILIAANHRSYSDPPLVGVSVPQHVHFIAKQELFSFKPFGALIRGLNAHPINRKFGGGALKKAQELLNEGLSVIVFPEGGRSMTENFRPFKSGVGLLSFKTNTPVVPAYLHNSAKLIWFKKLVVKFGPPLHPKDFSNYQDLVHALRDQFEALKKDVCQRY